ncbi:protein kinase domain-containing protein [Rheinheimera gaetbuli]
MSEQPVLTKDKAKASSKRRVVQDQYGAEYDCTELLGEGGQGKVWKTNHQNTLVKTFYKKDKVKQEQWFNHIQWVLRQDLDGLAIAAPKALITKPVPGYVMELMDGLHSLNSEMEQSFVALVEGKGLYGFLQTGGLKRRLQLLAQLADTLSRLHARGMAYGDLSPNNIFVSENVNDARVWLIDCDNICISERASSMHLYSPGFGAPEVVRGESGVNSLTDAWSFAVIAYQVLTMQHPLIGVMVEDGEPELQERAYRGELPWVGDSSNDCNASSGGIPLEMVATKKLHTLFKRCFEQGKNCSWERPTITEWRSSIDEAISQLLDCHNPKCRSTFNRNSACPFCKTEADPTDSVLLTALVYTTDPNLEQKYLKTGLGQVVNLNEVMTLKRVPAGTQLYRESGEVGQIRFDENGLALKVTSGNKIILLVDGKEQEITRGVLLSPDIKQGKSYFIHLTPPMPSDDVTTHPVWAFRW